MKQLNESKLEIKNILSFSLKTNKKKKYHFEKIQNNLSDNVIN